MKAEPPTYYFCLLIFIFSWLAEPPLFIYSKIYLFYFYMAGFAA
ncbi:hypothetical protein ACMBCN_00350 [Candidatus Liberibacter asiaticus]